MSSPMPKILSNPDDPDVDIVFVHGLLGDKVKTWTADDGILWPEKLLAKDFPKARISTFGYDSDVANIFRQVSQNGMKDNANDLCAQLVAMRRNSDAGNIPIVLVAHSLGGLICAEAIVMGDRNPSVANLQMIAKQTKGMVFLGTPFEGSNKASWAKKCVDILGLFMKVSKTNIENLKADASTLHELGDAFPTVLSKRDEPNSTEGKITTAFFYEQYLTNNMMIVDQSSATIPGRPDKASIPANHYKICKFSSNEDVGYKLVLAALQKMMEINPKDKSREGPIFNNYSSKINTQGTHISIKEQHNSF